MGRKIVALMLSAVLVSACSASGQSPPKPETAEPPSAAGGEAADEHREGPSPVVLTPQERARLGITTAPAQAATFTPMASGFGVVMSHEPIAQVAADLEVAAAAVGQSEAALSRAQHLAAGPGALGLDTLESLGKQTSSDRATLALARRKLTAVLGLQFPWQQAGVNAVLDALASGRAELVRATFPSGMLVGATPKSLRMIPYDPGAQSTMWTADTVWDAPQDETLPGRSFFALVKTAGIPEGSHLQVLPVGSANGASGVLVPAAALVISNDAYWCYLEKKEGTFVRVPIDVSRPLGQGYFVSAGVAHGDPVVTSAAGLLLAREMNPSSESAD
jgi:hypothetical protein